jgi:hypothetical protein
MGSNDLAVLGRRGECGSGSDEDDVDDSVLLMQSDLLGSLGA